MFGRVLSGFTNVAQRMTTTVGFIAENASVGGAWSLMPARFNIRNHFPRPNEAKRVNRHGWLKRMSTPGGKKILMRRILKGKHVLSH